MSEVCAVVGLDLLLWYGTAMENSKTPLLAAIPVWIALDSSIPRCGSQVRMTPAEYVIRNTPSTSRTQGSSVRNSTLFQSLERQRQWITTPLVLQPTVATPVVDCDLARAARNSSLPIHVGSEWLEVRQANWARTGGESPLWQRK